VATPSLTRHRLPGYLGDILVDVRTGDRTRPRPAVLVLHGFKGFKGWGMFPPLSERLARAGFTAVTFNVSGSGVDDTGEFTRPEHFARATFTGDLGDVRSVITAVSSGALGFPPAASLGFLGHSRGGGLGVLAAGTDSRIDALVTWAAISHVHRFPPEEIAAWRRRGQIDIHNARTGQVLPICTDLLDDVERHAGSTLDIAAAAGRVTAPWLIVHGDADLTVPISEAHALHAASGSRADLLVLTGTGHTFDTAHPWQGPTAGFTSAADATLQWFGKHLG